MDNTNMGEKSKEKNSNWIRNLFQRLFNRTTLGFVSGVMGMGLMFIVNRFLDGNVRDIDTASKAIKIMLLQETILILLTFILFVIQEVKILHSMNIKVFSLDLFRLDPTDELTDYEEK